MVSNYRECVTSFNEGWMYGFLLIVSVFPADGYLTSKAAAGNTTETTTIPTMYTNEAYPYPYTLKSETNHTGTIIFLHGTGDIGQDWYLDFLRIREPYMKIVLPNAKTMPVRSIRNHSMPSWFDFTKPGKDENERQIRASTEYIHNIINAEIKNGIRSRRIVLGGFSQGGALALRAGLTFNKKLGGIVVIGAWLPLKKGFSQTDVTANRNIPILQLHGENDEVVPYNEGRECAQTLDLYTNKMDFRTYHSCRHAASKEQIQDMRQFIQARVGTRKIFKF